MAFITGLWLVDLFLAVVFLLIILLFYMNSAYSYWKDRNVPFVKPAFDYDALFGKKSHAEQISEMYNQFKGERFLGFYQFRNPSLIIKDPNLIENILIKDFSHFEDRGLPLDAKHEPLTVNLVNLKGDQWRGLRHKLTPTFSSGKLKGMFHQMINCGEEMLKYIEQYAETGEEVDAKTATWLFNTNVIASCAFGLQFQSDSEEGKRFMDMANKASGRSGYAIIRFVLKTFFPTLATCLGVKTIPTDVSDYFISLTKTTMDHRTKNDIKRGDFFQLLLSLKEQENIGKTSDLTGNMIEPDDIQLKYIDKCDSQDSSLQFTDELLAAQTFVFLTAGSETVSNTTTVILHFLAEYPKVQQRLQAEVDSVLAKHNGEWTYQTVKDMTYLDQVIQESQRMFPIAFVQLRICTTPYKVPDSDLIIEKGTVVLIPTQAIHMDPVHYPDPEVFNPDRFEGNNFRSSPIFTPFGDGPRMCIAMRFAILEMKVFVAQLMSKFSVKQSPKTLTPLRYDPKALQPQPLGGIWVSFQSRNA